MHKISRNNKGKCKKKICKLYTVHTIDYIRRGRYLFFSVLLFCLFEMVLTVLKLHLYHFIRIIEKFAFKYSSELPFYSENIARFKLVSPTHSGLALIRSAQILDIENINV